jgi:small subunit ribosomal protein S16
MSVIIRLSKSGTKNKPFYRVVAACKSRARDGKFIERLGTFDPKSDNSFKVNKERVAYWLSVGAQPSGTVGELLKSVK